MVRSYIQSLENLARIDPTFSLWGPDIVHPLDWTYFPIPVDVGSKYTMARMQRGLEVLNNFFASPDVRVSLVML